MVDRKSKKELKAQYKEREMVGGVYMIINTLTGRILLRTDTDLQGSKNRFEFSQKTGSCVDRLLQSDWNKEGAGIFILEVLEELKKGETQTEEKFEADINFLKEIWLDKLSGRDFY